LLRNPAISQNKRRDTAPSWEQMDYTEGESTHLCPAKLLSPAQIKMTLFIKTILP